MRKELKCKHCTIRYPGMLSVCCTGYRMYRMEKWGGILCLWRFCIHSPTWQWLRTSSSCFFGIFFAQSLTRAQRRLIPEVRKCVSPTSQDENITLIYEISADLYPTKEARSKHNKSFFRTDQSVLLHPLTFGILNWLQWYYFLPITIIVKRFRKKKKWCQVNWIDGESQQW